MTRPRKAQTISWDSPFGTESIKWLIENQTFSPSYNLVPRPPSPLPPPIRSRQQVVFLPQSFCVLLVELIDGRKGRGGWRAKSYDGENSLSSIIFASFCLPGCPCPVQCHFSREENSLLLPFYPLSFSSGYKRLNATVLGKILLFSRCGYYLRPQST